jgi:hypothetical protein
MDVHPTKNGIFIGIDPYPYPGNGPFIDGLPIKNGDFPWLC